MRDVANNPGGKRGAKGRPRSQTSSLDLERSYSANALKIAADIRQRLSLHGHGAVSPQDSPGVSSNIDVDDILDTIEPARSECTIASR